MGIELYNHPEILSYLQTKHQELRNDYKTPDGQYIRSCGLIAIDVARKVLSTGTKPQLIKLEGMLLPGSNINTEWLIPIIYGGRVKWSAHIIACVGETTLDPMVGIPMLLEEYKSTVFQRPANAEVEIPVEEIEEFINN
jgi:hypothetical protein